MVASNDIRDAQRKQWAAAAAGWEKHFAWYAQTTRPLQDWFARAASLAPGMHVLDVACGTGVPALTAARCVQPGGRVVAVDMSLDMLAAAGRHARSAGLENVELREADAQSLPFPDATFDAATSSFGLMFCPEPARAVAEIRRVLKPGGRAAVAVWDEPPRNPFFTTIGKELAKLVPQPPPDPDAPGPFRLAPPGKLQALLEGAGLEDVTVGGCPMTFAFPSFEDYWQLVNDCSANMRASIAALGADDRDRLHDAAAQAAVPYTHDGALRLPATPLCAAARRPVP